MSIEFSDLLGPGAALIAVLAGIIQYRITSGRQLAQYKASAESDFIKPFREAQLRLYIEASSAAARMATLKPESPEWQKSYDDFSRLYYGPMGIVEDFERAPEGPDNEKLERIEENESELTNPPLTGPRNSTPLTVEDAMFAFKQCLDSPEKGEDHENDLYNLSLALAHTCRESLARSWGYEIPQFKDGGYQRFAIEYLNRPKVIGPDDDTQKGPMP